MDSLEKFDSFAKKFLVDWENKSTVRSRKRGALQKEAIPEINLPFFIKPYLKYPEVQALNDEQLAPFYIQSFCDVLHGVTQFEVNFVTDQCGKLANKDLGLELSDSIRLAAIAIGTDEMYHAFVARELLADLKALTGVIPTALKPLANVAEQVSADAGEEKAQPPVMVTPLEYFKSAVPPKLERIAETTLLCILENAVVDDFFELAKESKDHNPISVYNKEHLHDEGRHKVFFQRLLKYIWDTISEDDRIVLGRAVAGYFEQYFVSNNSYQKQLDIHKKNLKNLDLSPDCAHNIATQLLIEESHIPPYDLEFIKNPMRLMEFAGLTQHAPTQQLFVRLGLLEDLVEYA
jgi:hypothetical protein